MGRQIGKHLIVLSSYCALSIIMTWPLCLRIGSHLFGTSGDTSGTVWVIWNYVRDAAGSWQMIAAPFGVDKANIIRQPVYEIFLIMAGKLFGEIAGYNLIVLLSFPLTAAATFLLMKRLGLETKASFMGGFIFGFCPGAVMRAVGGHLSFALNFFIPLFILALFHNQRKRTMVSAFFVALAYVGAALNSLYFGYFLIFVGLFFLTVDYLSRSVSFVRFVSNYALCGVFTAILLSPMLFRTIFYQLTTSAGKLASVGRIRDLESLRVYSARALEYILPSIDHPLVGPSIVDFVRNNLHGSNATEQTLYVGLVPIFLCFTGLFLWSGNTGGSRRNCFIFFVAGSLFMIFLSLPPLIELGDVYIPTLSFFAFKIAPMFRVYARFGILAQLFIAGAAAVVLTELKGRLSSKGYAALLLVLSPLLIFEYWNFSPKQLHSVRPPAVYEWLAREPGDFIVAEYPMLKGDEAGFSTYLFWQRVHNKAIVDGATPYNPKAWDFFNRIKDLSDPSVPGLLKAVGVKYVIVHPQMYRDGDIPAPLKRRFPPDISARSYNAGEVPLNPLLQKPYKVFGEDMVYTL